jgi:hypothetical protein
MQLASLTSAAQSILRQPEAKEGPGPDRDGDSDDKAAVTARVAATPPGMGVAVNTVA